MVHLGERDCSLQRRHQKLVEVAPSPALDEELRRRIHTAAVELAASAGFANIGTFEFLADVRTGAFAFIEANPRLQVEHTVTEQVTGVDLVATQIRLASGATLADLGLDEPPAPRGYAVQARVNMERMTADGAAVPSGGVLAAFVPPSGPGVRVDTFGYPGYRTSPHYDSLLAKVIGYGPRDDFESAVRRTYRALCEFQIEGVETNLGFLENLLCHPEFLAGRVHTRFVDERAAELAAPAAHAVWYPASDGAGEPAVAEAHSARTWGRGWTLAIRWPCSTTVGGAASRRPGRRQRPSRVLPAPRRWPRPCRAR